MSGIVRQIQGGEYLARDYSRLQQELSSAEGELSVVTHELAEASKVTDCLLNPLLLVIPFPSSLIATESISLITDCL